MKKGLTMLVAVMVIFGLICVIGSVVAYIWVESDVKGVGLRHPHPYVPDFEMIDLGNGSVSINNNGTNFMRIQAAVDNATAGDTIIVSNGTYIENIKVNKSLTIRSENGSAATIIYALDSKVHVFNVTVNYVNISGFTIVGAYYNAGIYLNEAYNCTLENNNCSHNDHGFLLKNSSDNGVERNTAAENHYGITLICSNNNHVSNNNCSYNQAGIYSNNSLNNNIEWNTCFGNDHEGIRFLNSPNNNIEWNTCLGNCHGGIRLSNSDSTSIANNTCFGNYFEGIKLVKSDSTSIANNICIHNHNGISLCHSNKNVIKYNRISNNSDSPDRCLPSCRGVTMIELELAFLYDIYLIDSNDNFVYLNNIINNTEYDAYSNPNNVWHAPSMMNYTYNNKTFTNYMSNYWDDYEGTDADGDGIGDTHFSIDSDSDESDNYPLMQPFENYVI